MNLMLTVTLLLKIDTMIPSALLDPGYMHADSSSLGLECRLVSLWEYFGNVEVTGSNLHK